MAVDQLGGRAFLRMEEGTVRWRFELERLLSVNGLTNLAVRDEETAGQFAQRIYDQISAKGIAGKLIGYMIHPADKSPEDWRPEMAAETEEFVLGLKAAEDHGKVSAILVDAILWCFAHGFVSLWTSPRSSMADPEKHESTIGEIKAALGMRLGER